MKRSSFSRNVIAYIGVLITVSCLSVIIFSILRLPDVTVNLNMPRKLNHHVLQVEHDYVIGKFGEVMLEMLPQDLSFTIFMPSQNAFERDLRLNLSDSLVLGEKFNDTYAILSRILGFSVVPRRIVSGSVDVEKERCYDSLSGFGLFVSKDEKGMLMVNRVRCERMDVMRGKIVLHIMDGVIMDADFEQSVGPDFGEED
ncbi:FAS1 domain-containing protein [Heracleum sosnowskyi]|uniref:FAS1 domain-containing protein n=1 Tax=Heracleum sosnowskyi TaxID=360622 RepID=A0AAD8GXQ7_9APIA|nr:FAS1 domain-containing protein [Heracleum sosnowskyi]